MTITLGGVDISNNMYLSGLESAPLVSVEQVRTIDGVSYVRSTPTPGGRTFTLGTQSKTGTVIGLWCSTVIDQVKVLESLADPVTLDYRGDIYEVIIVETSFDPFHAFEVEGPNKKFTGTITLIEV